MVRGTGGGTIGPSAAGRPGTAVHREPAGTPTSHPAVAGTSGRFRPTGRLGEARAVASWIAVTLVCVYAAVNLFGSISYQVAGLEIRISARIGVPGYSGLSVPPIGRVEARTHVAPLQIRATLENIDPDVLQDALSRGEVPSSISTQFKEDSRKLVTLFAARLAFLAAAGGAFGAAAASGWNLRRALKGAAVGLAAGATLIALTHATFDRGKLANPRYEGVIEAAPWMLGLLDGSLLKAGEIAGSMQTIGANIRTFFDRAQAFHELESDRPFIRVLHVSDVHSNPQAFDFVAQIVQSFKPDFIIDTGDVTDFGTLPEARMAARRVKGLGVPYLLVLGNHDSPEVAKVMSSEGGAVVLSDGVADFMGMRIAALQDPGALRADMAPASQDERKEAQEKVEAMLSVPQDDPGRTPDLLAVHSAAVAEGAVGRVGAVLSGHDHRLAVAVREGTVLVNAGTTGGAGLRGFQVEGGVPMSVALLHFAADEPDERGGRGPVRVVAVDTIRIFGERQGFDLERTLVERI